MKKKLLFLSAANSIHTVRWVNSLSDSYEVHLVYCKNHKPSLNIVNSKIILHELKYKSPLGYYLNFAQLRKIYYVIKPDVINVHYASGYGTLARISKLPNILLSVWGSDVYDFPNQSKLKQYIFRKNIFYAKYLASTSNAMAKTLRNTVKKLKKEIFITPFGVDVNTFKKTYKKMKKKDFIIVNIKTLNNEVYGIDKGILAFKKLIDKLKKDKDIVLLNKIKFNIYGSGRDEENLKKLIINNKLEKYVKLKGKVSNEKVPEILNNSDLFFATSNKESFGVSVVEALSCEKTVVATDVDGFKEIIDNNETGILVKTGNIDEMSEALYYMLKNEDERIKFGKKGRKTVLEKFNWKENVNTMIDIYEKIMKEAKSNE